MYVRPLDYFDASQFYPAFSNVDKIKLYSVFGGIPYYLQYVDPSLSAEDNIIQLIVEKNSRLEPEITMWLTTEMTRIPLAPYVFTVLANGTTHFNDIQAKSHIKTASELTRVLEKLIAMHLVRKEAPINDAKNRKKTNYFINDRLILFYYTYVFPNISLRCYLNSHPFFDLLIRQNFETQFVPKAFEQVTREYLLRQNRAGLLDAPFFGIGKYWYVMPEKRRNGEFGIVTQDSNGYVFYEAEFRSSPVSRSMIDQEKDQVRSASLNCCRFGFVSRSGFSCSPSPDEEFTILQDLFRDPEWAW